MPTPSKDPYRSKYENISSLAFGRLRMQTINHEFIFYTFETMLQISLAERIRDVLRMILYRHSNNHEGHRTILKYTRTMKLEVHRKTDVNTKMLRETLDNVA